MKRRDLIKYLTGKGCTLHREGAKHSVFINSINRKSATVPRHTEIDFTLVRRICRELRISIPDKKS
ncbi:MAG: type II toxin-antitoxin system HicA family toxin [Chloroflexi bacterium]|nr:type II toxin-antitoxin system HicA family toxin [Chloroflexota bacterium]